MSSTIQRKFEDDSFDQFNNEIENLHDQWKAMPGADQETVDKLVNTLKKFHPNATDAEAFQGIVSFCCIFN